jgi:hypothetical protein
LEYVLDFALKEVLGVTYSVTHSEAEFELSNVFRLNYSHRQLACDLHIESIGLLYETELVEKEIQVSQWQGMPVLFETSSTQVPFDLFSAIFYLISRYEEYQPYEPDEYLRYPHTQSVAFLHQFLDLPLVDMWLHSLKQILLKSLDKEAFELRQFSFVPTYDIDIAYSYKGKGVIRTLGGLGKDFLHGKWKSISDRIAVLNGNKPDPYDSYSRMDVWHEKYQLEPIYFFLLSDGGPMDKNLPYDVPCMQSLLKKIQNRYRVGIHPSWLSHADASILKNEYKRLGDTQLSRQHYIRYTLPDTFRQLIQLGIQHDYSMGYGSINGFRASTSHAMMWFDLEQNCATSLRLHPFCFMECNAFFEQKMSSEEALEQLHRYVKILKQVNGRLITIWHNFSLGTDPLWAGWPEMYGKFLEEIGEEG